MAVGSPELRKLISRKQKARWRRYFEEHPEVLRKPQPAKLPHDEVHERRAASHRKPVVGISARTGERIRFDSLLAAAEFLFAQGETSSVVAAQLIISQVCNGHRRTGFGYYWEFPHRGRPMTLATRGKNGRKTRETRREAFAGDFFNAHDLTKMNAVKTRPAKRHNTKMLVKTQSKRGRFA